jgi:PKHD-type hydroxylase
MNLNIHYWYYNSALPKHVCDQIIKLAELKNKEKFYSQRQAQIGGRKQDLSRFPLSKIEKEKLIETRDSQIQWLDDNWIYKEIHPFLNHANTAAKWDFEYDWSESCQFTTYRKGDHYTWHCDSFPHTSKTTDRNIHGKVRKLSMTVQLSDPKDYEGGEFQFDFRDTEDGSPNIRTVSEATEKGSIIVFPSHLYHRVLPVKKGKRLSLVVWTLGQPFR